VCIGIKLVVNVIGLFLWGLRAIGLSKQINQKKTTRISIKPCDIVNVNTYNIYSPLSY
jgi:hypothetical protein